MLNQGEFPFIHGSRGVSGQIPAIRRLSCVTISDLLSHRVSRWDLTGIGKLVATRRTTLGMERVAGERQGWNATLRGYARKAGYWSKYSADREVVHHYRLLLYNTQAS
jgi:hypothetical protein